MKNIKQAPTVTIALSAYNEEKNIGLFLHSVLTQKESGFVIKHIFVYSDGSTDNTVKIARSVSSKIVVKEFGRRAGKSQRLNQIYSALDTDFLVQSDADTVFAHPFVIRDMLKPLMKNNDVAMCGGNPQPVQATTFVERAVNYTFEAYAPLRKKFRGGNNIFSVDGRILSYKKELVKKIHIPLDITANDAYTYYCCLTSGYKYHYVPTAIVYFRSPKTLKDQIKQNTRFLSAPIKMSEHFGTEIVKRERHIPVFLLAKYLFPEFIKHPIPALFIFFVNKYCKIQALIKYKRVTAKWDMVISTKSIKMKYD